MLVARKLFPFDLAAWDRLAADLAPFASPETMEALRPFVAEGGALCEVAELDPNFALVHGETAAVEIECRTFRHVERDGVRRCAVCEVLAALTSAPVRPVGRLRVSIARASFVPLRLHPNTAPLPFVRSFSGMFGGDRAPVRTGASAEDVTIGEVLDLSYRGTTTALVRWSSPVRPFALHCPSPDALVSAYPDPGHQLSQAEVDCLPVGTSVMISTATLSSTRALLEGYYPDGRRRARISPATTLTVERVGTALSVRVAYPCGVYQSASPSAPSSACALCGAPASVHAGRWATSARAVDCGHPDASRR